MTPRSTLVASGHAPRARLRQSVPQWPAGLQQQVLRATSSRFRGGNLIPPQNITRFRAANRGFLHPSPTFCHTAVSFNPHTGTSRWAV